MVITFVGHRDIPISTELSNNIAETIKSNISEHEPVTFYCGGYGHFDFCCAQVCHSLKNEIPSCEIVLVTPYISPSHQAKLKHWTDSKLYDAIIYPPIEKTPPRFAILKRNQWMISQADLVIAYVLHSIGGAYSSLEYAYQKKKRIINLAQK